MVSKVIVRDSMVLINSQVSQGRRMKATMQHYFNGVSRPYHFHGRPVINRSRSLVYLREPGNLYIARRY